MFLEGSGPVLEDVLLSDQFLFDCSPADSIINFELPTITPSSSWTSDFNFEGFDINALDHNIEDSDLLQALNCDSNEPFSNNDSTDTEDIFCSRLPLLSDLDPYSGDFKTEKVEKIQSWGEPTFCTELNAYRCPVEICGKLYAKASHVRAHLRRHSGEKPYICTWGDCKWRFARSDELARHKRSHSGDKPYVCRECGKRFARSDHLTKHGKVHARRRAAALAANAGTKRTTYIPRTRRLL